MTYEDLKNCERGPDESFKDYAIRYNKIVDVLNVEMDKKYADEPLMRYSKLTFII